MAQAMVNFRMDAGLKKEMESVCKAMGMSMTTAFNVFATRVCKDRRIPFDVFADQDPFYSEENMARLRQAIEDCEAGRNMHEHELVEVDDEEVMA